MKIRYTVTILFFLSLLVRAQWVQTSTPPFWNVRSFAFSDTNLFAGGDIYGVYRSSNNGESWTWASSGLSGGVYTLAIGAGGTNLFAGTLGSGVFLSTNKGTSWTPVNNGLTNSTIYTLVVSGMNLFAGTEGGIFLSTNNGTSWTPVNSGLTSLFVRTLAVSPNGPGGTNLFAGTEGGIFLTTNDGASWTTANAGLGNNDVYTFAISPNGASGTNLFAGTIGGAGVYLSTDNGLYWAPVNSGLTNNNVRGLAVSGNNLFAGTYSGGVFLSTNNGTSWTEVNSGLTNTNVLALTVTSTNLFAGTFSGGVWRRLLSDMITSVDPSSSEIPTEFSLEQNYPNPFNPSTTIKYQLAQDGRVSLKIYDILGNEVSTLVNENQKQGEYEIEFDARSLTSGVYFYKLQTGSFLQTKKMILLK